MGKLHSALLIPIINKNKFIDTMWQQWSIETMSNLIFSILTEVCALYTLFHQCTQIYSIRSMICIVSVYASWSKREEICSVHQNTHLMSYEINKCLKSMHQPWVLALLHGQPTNTLKGSCNKIEIHEVLLLQQTYWSLESDAAEPHTCYSRCWCCSLSKTPSLLINKTKPTNFMKQKTKSYMFGHCC
jgi:hypothetical protein